MCVINQVNSGVHIKVTVIRHVYALKYIFVITSQLKNIKVIIHTVEVFGAM